MGSSDGMPLAGGNQKGLRGSFTLEEGNSGEAGDSGNQTVRQKLNLVDRGGGDDPSLVRGGVIS